MYYANLPALPLEIANAVGSAALPEAYEAATAAMAQCDRIDEIDDWADKFAALASYARQAHDPELENFAKRIRARAVRRMGELLREYDGRRRASPPTFGTAESMSPPTLSRGEAADAVGVSRHKALTAVRVAQVPQAQFETLVGSGSPPGTTRLVAVGTIAWSSRDTGPPPTGVVVRVGTEETSCETITRVSLTEPRRANCTVSDVRMTADGFFGFSILGVALAFKTAAAAEQARAAVGEAVTIRASD